MEETKFPVTDDPKPEHNSAIDNAVLENQPLVDFSELEESVKNDHIEQKRKIEAEMAKEKQEEKENTVIYSDKSNKLREKLNHDTGFEMSSGFKRSSVEVEKKTEVKIEKIIEPPKEKSNMILEEDDSIIKDEKPLTELSEEDEKEFEALINSTLPSSRRHSVTLEKSDKKEEYIIDTDQKEKIVETDTSSEEDKKNKEEKRKKIEEYLEKKTGFKIYGGEGGTPCIIASENPNVKGLKEIDIPVDKIKPIANNDEDLKRAFLDQYITLANAKDSPVADHRISRFPLLLSGYYAEMTDYSMGELSGIIRTIRNPELKFARKFQQELISLFNHISWTSLKPDGEKLTFEEWLKATKFKDLNMFYFGGYDATYPGIGRYDITCGNCKHSFSVNKSNRGLSYMLQNGNDPMLTDSFIKDVLRQIRPIEELKKTLVYTKANSIYDEKVIKPHSIRIAYGCPTLLDILEYLSVFEGLLDTDIDDFEAIIDDEMDGHNILTMYSLIKSITVPVVRGKNSEGKNVISFIKIDTEVENAEERMENRQHIVRVLKSLPESEFGELFTGPKVAEKKRLVGIVHILHNIECPNCKSNISRIPIDMRSNFFIRTANTVDQIEQF